MKVPEKYYDEIFNFKGQWDMPSKCGLKLLKYQDKTLIMVTELYQDNPGTSVTYGGVSLAKQICEKKNLDFQQVLYFECNPDTHSKLSFYDEEFFLVDFSQTTDIQVQGIYHLLTDDEVRMYGLDKL